MLTTYGTRLEHFNADHPFDSQRKQRVGFKLDGWSKALIDGLAFLIGFLLLAPCLLVLFSPLIASVIR